MAPLEKNSTAGTSAATFEVFAKNFVAQNFNGQQLNGFSRSTAALPSQQCTTQVLRLLVYGDSLTVGFSLGANGLPQFEPYAKELSQSLAAKGVHANIVGCGLSGLTTAQLASSRDASCVRDYVGCSGPGLRRIISDKGPFDMVIIMAGTNDIGKGFLPDDIVSNLKVLHSTCHALGIPTIALSIPDCGHPMHSPALRSKVNKAFKDWVISRSSSPRISFMDAREMLPWSSVSQAKGLWHADSIHFTPAGSQEFGKNLASALVQSGVLPAHAPVQSIGQAASVQHLPTTPRTQNSHRFVSAKPNDGAIKVEFYTAPWAEYPNKRINDKSTSERSPSTDLEDELPKQDSISERSSSDDLDVEGCRGASPNEQIAIGTNLPNEGFTPDKCGDDHVLHRASFSTDCSGSSSESDTGMSVGTLPKDESPHSSHSQTAVENDIDRINSEFTPVTVQFASLVETLRKIRERRDSDKPNSSSPRTVPSSQLLDDIPIREVAIPVSLPKSGTITRTNLDTWDSFHQAVSGSLSHRTLAPSSHGSQDSARNSQRSLACTARVREIAGRDFTSTSKTLVANHSFPTRFQTTLCNNRSTRTVRSTRMDYAFPQTTSCNRSGMLVR